jgi:putative flippase GtrA
MARTKSQLTQIFVEFVEFFQRIGTLKEISRFIIFGILNAGITYGIYLALNTFLDYRLSYTVSYILGILIAVFFNGRFVFQTKVTKRSGVIYALFYVASYVVGLVSLAAFVDIFKVSESIAPLLVLVIVVPLNFIFGRLILTGRFLKESKS